MVSHGPVRFFAILGLLGLVSAPWFVFEPTGAGLGSSSSARCCLSPLVAASTDDATTTPIASPSSQERGEPTGTDDRIELKLGYAGLIATILLGGAAIFVSVHFDRRARSASHDATATLGMIKDVVANLNPTVVRIETGVHTSAGQLTALQQTLMFVYRDVLGLVDASERKFRRGDDLPSGAAGRVGSDGGPLADRAKVPEPLGPPGTAADIGSTNKGGPMHHGVLNDAHPEDIQSRILSVLVGLGGETHAVKAVDIVSSLPDRCDLSVAITELYRLRLSLRVSWSDAILGPDTEVSLSSAPERGAGAPSGDH